MKQIHKRCRSDLFRILGNVLFNLILVCACFGISAPWVFAQTTRQLSLTLAQPVVFWGQSSTGTATLSQPAPSGGTWLRFVQQDPGVTITPVQLFLPEGQTTATFRVTTAPGSRNFDSRTIDAVLSDTGTFTDNTGVYGRVSLSIEPIWYSITLPERAVGGSIVNGMVSMGRVPIGGSVPLGNRTAPENIVVTFFVDPRDIDARDYLIVPQAIVLQAGQTSVPFQLGTKPLPIGYADKSPLLSATGGGTSAASSLKLEAHRVTAFTLAPARAVGNEPVTATVTLHAPAPAGGLRVSIGQQSPITPRLFEGYQSVVVAPGQTTGSMRLSAPLPNSVTQEVEVKMTIPFSDASATMKFLPPPPPPPTLASVTLANPTLFWGQGTTGTATLSGPAPVGGMVVEFVPGTLGNGLTATPDPITFESGQTAATFQIASTAGTPPRPTARRPITAIVRGTTDYRSAILTMERPVVTLSLNAARAAGAAPIAGTANMGSIAFSSSGDRTGNRPAPVDIVVALSSSVPSALTVSPTVTIPAGQTSAAFTVSPSEVASITNVQIRGSGTAEVYGAAVNLEPLAITGVAINPARIVGGMQATGKVTLSGIAGQSGTAVRITSTGNATVPATVTVPAGQSEANFNISTTAVTQETGVSVYASRPSGPSATATLTLVTEQQGRTADRLPIQVAPPTMRIAGVAMAAPATANSPFTSDCGHDGVMAGIRVRSGTLVDSVQAICVKVSSTGAWAGGQFDGTRAGGNGGSQADLLCDQGSAVTAVFGNAGNLIDRVGVRCGRLGVVGGMVKIVSGSASKGPVGGTGGSGFDQPCRGDGIVRGISGAAGTLVSKITVNCHNPTAQPGPQKK